MNSSVECEDIRPEEEVTSELVKDIRCEGLVLFSGGFDSIAVLHKAIVSDQFYSITALFEKCSRFPEGEAGTFKAKKAFSILKRIAKKHNCKLIWLEEQINTDAIDNSIHSGGDILLFYHLSTALRHGEINNIYLGWNRDYILSDGISKQILEWYEKTHYAGFNLFFLDDIFDAENRNIRKVVVVKYLLENNLFGLPYSSAQYQFKADYEKRTIWFDYTDEKEHEVAVALVGTNCFSAEDLSKIFTMRTTQEIQDYYNQSKNKKNK